MQYNPSTQALFDPFVRISEHRRCDCQELSMFTSQERAYMSLMLCQYEEGFFKNTTPWFPTFVEVMFQRLNEFFSTAHYHHSQRTLDAPGDVDRRFDRTDVHDALVQAEQLIVDNLERESRSTGRRAGDIDQAVDGFKAPSSQASVRTAHRDIRYHASRLGWILPPPLSREVEERLSENRALRRYYIKCLDQAWSKCLIARAEPEHRAPSYQQTARDTQADVSGQIRGHASRGGDASQLRTALSLIAEASVATRVSQAHERICSAAKSAGLYVPLAIPKDKVVVLARRRDVRQMYVDQLLKIWRGIGRDNTHSGSTPAEEVSSEADSSENSDDDNESCEDASDGDDNGRRRATTRPPDTHARERNRESTDAARALRATQKQPRR